MNDYSIIFQYLVKFICYNIMHKYRNSTNFALDEVYIHEDAHRMHYTLISTSLALSVHRVTTHTIQE